MTLQAGPNSMISSSLLTLSTYLEVTLSQPPAGTDKLNEIQDILENEKGTRHGGDDPRDGRVHLVGPGDFECSSTPRIGKDGIDWLNSGRAWLEGRARGGIRPGLQE